MPAGSRGSIRPGVRPWSAATAGVGPSGRPCITRWVSVRSGMSWQGPPPSGCPGSTRAGEREWSSRQGHLPASRETLPSDSKQSTACPSIDWAIISCATIQTRGISGFRRGRNGHAPREDSGCCRWPARRGDEHKYCHGGSIYILNEEPIASTSVHPRSSPLPIWLLRLPQVAACPGGVSPLSRTEPGLGFPPGCRRGRGPASCPRSSQGTRITIRISVLVRPLRSQVAGPGPRPEAAAFRLVAFLRSYGEPVVGGDETEPRETAR